MIQPYDSSLIMAARRVSPRIHSVPALKTSIIRFVDAVDVPVAVTNRAGKVTQMNGPAREFFIGRVGARLREAVETLARVTLGERKHVAEGVPNRVRRIDIGHQRFTVTLVLAGNDVASQDIGAMLMLRRETSASSPAITESALVSRFQLTPQEARVALMLADHRSNREIAARLGVSVHTARHHTERVLAKLEIHSRHDVRRAIS